MKIQTLSPGSKEWVDKYRCDADGCEVSTSAIGTDGNPFGWYTSHDKREHFCTDCAIELAKDIQEYNKATGREDAHVPKRNTGSFPERDGECAVDRGYGRGGLFLD